MNKIIMKAINQKGRDAIEGVYKEFLKTNPLTKTIVKGVWRFDRVSEDPLIIEAVINPRYKTFVHNDTAKENFLIALEFKGAKNNDDFTLEVL